MIICGIVIGFFFDIYRIIRWRIKLNKYLTFMTDLIFSGVTCFAIIFFAQKANYFDFRFYVFGGCFIGLIIHLKFFGKITKKAINKQINLITYLGFLVKKTNYMLWKSISYLMKFPYGVLRWFAMLFFRMGEAFGKEVYYKLRNWAEILKKDVRK